MISFKLKIVEEIHFKRDKNNNEIKILKSHNDSN